MPARLMPRQTRRGERGSLSIEMVLLFPLAMALIVMFVQITVVFLGHSVAKSAATEGARSCAALKGSREVGIRQAEILAAQVGTNDLLSGSAATGTRDEGAGVCTITVTGKTLSLIPGWDPNVKVSSARPIEKFTSFDGGG